MARIPIKPLLPIPGRIEAALTASNLNRAELSRILNVAKVTITYYFSGSLKMNSDCIEKCATALNVSVQFINTGVPHDGLLDGLASQIYKTSLAYRAGRIKHLLEIELANYTNNFEDSLSVAQDRYLQCGTPLQYVDAEYCVIRLLPTEKSILKQLLTDSGVSAANPRDFSRIVQALIRGAQLNDPSQMKDTIALITKEERAQTRALGDSN